jgi:hypothetical protein
VLRFILTAIRSPTEVMSDCRWGLIAASLCAWVTAAGGAADGRAGGGRGAE